MTGENEFWVEVDPEGRLILPEEVRERYALHPGAQLRLKMGSKTLRLHRPISQLARVYIEPTSRCNLNCRTCIRNAWEEPQGDMTAGTFDRLIKSLEASALPPRRLLRRFRRAARYSRTSPKWCEQAKAVAGKVELITNGMLLTEQRSRELIDAGLDMLWVSLDGATPESYADVRLGAALPQILENIRRHFHAAPRNRRAGRRSASPLSPCESNIADLPALIRMGPKLGVSRYMVTNVFPYTEEMCKEMLYTRLDRRGRTRPPLPGRRASTCRAWTSDQDSQDAIVQAMRYRHNVHLNGVTLGQDRGRCPFIEKGAVAVCWDGAVSPCLALMHQYKTFLHNRPRSVQRHSVGRLDDLDLASIWNAPDYVAFRKRVEAFDFSPCTWCGGCSWSEANQEDCFANTFPTCGGCLWAQGVIQCP